MTKPLALVVYENLMPGSKLVNRLHDLGYRVQTLPDATNLVAHAEKEKPLVAILDLASQKNDCCALIRQMKENAATAHVPILAFANSGHMALQKAAVEAGAALVAGDEAIITQLPRLLDHVLCLD